MNFSVLCVLLVLISGALALRAKTCLPGHKHKETPSTEGADFAACQIYQKSSCCKASFTRQLASPPIKAVGNFSWTPCGGNLSSECEAFMVKIECFYRCSPNVAFWKKPTYPSAFIGAPLCSRFCDAWFNACKSDLTCAKNWQTDFNFTTQPSTCGTVRSCRNMSEVYTDGKDMCESLWGPSFTYKKSKEAGDCLDLNNLNDMVVDYYFGDKSAAPPPTSVGVLVAAQKHCLIIITAAFSGFISINF